MIRRGNRHVKAAADKAVNDVGKLDVAAVALGNGVDWDDAIVGASWAPRNQAPVVALELADWETDGGGAAFSLWHVVCCGHRRPTAVPRENRVRETVYDIDSHEHVRFPPPGRCIYCGSTEALTDEHVIPYALGANTTIFEKASCRQCADTIQPYEQDILRRQLGNFRLQVDAPSRTPAKNRRRHIDLEFHATDVAGRIIRDLGTRSCEIDDAPLALNLWNLPEPKVLLPPFAAPGSDARPWAWCDALKAKALCRRVAEETGSLLATVKLGDVNQDSFMRFLAKVAHSYAVAELGLEAFRPFLLDAILRRASLLWDYVGGGPDDEETEAQSANTVLIRCGRADDPWGRELVVVRLRFFPQLGSPAYVVVVGERLQELSVKQVL